MKTIENTKVFFDSGEFFSGGSFQWIEIEHEDLAEFESEKVTQERGLKIALRSGFESKDLHTAMVEDTVHSTPKDWIDVMFHTKCFFVWNNNSWEQVVLCFEAN